MRDAMTQVDAEAHAPAVAPTGLDGLPGAFPGRPGAGMDAEREAARCETCGWWSGDDDGDGRGCCALRLNDPECRDWRTRPDDGCAEHLA